MAEKDKNDKRNLKQHSIEKNSSTAMNTQQHSIVQSIGLHLLPGVLILVFYAITVPLVRRLGFPSMFALNLAGLLILIPFELGYLFFQGKKKNSRLSLKGIVLYRERMSVWQYVVLCLILGAWLGFCMLIIAPLIDDFLIETLFFWLPDWFFFGFSENMTQYSQSVLLATWFLALVLNGIAAPITEELYFRGYLLPRISRLKGWAPFINVLLFSLYHFHTPWQNLPRILGLLPLVYAVWWKKNIYLSIIIHCVGNTIAMFLMLPLFLSSL